MNQNQSLNIPMEKRVDLTFNGKPLADNADITLMEVSNIFNADSSYQQNFRVRFRVFSENGEILRCEEMEYDRSDIVNSKKKLDVPEWFPFKARLTNKVFNYLRDEFLRLENGLEVIDSYNYYPGFNFIGDKLMYNTGDALITKDGISNYTSDIGYELDRCEFGSDCVEFVMKVMTDIPVLRAMMIASFVPFTLFLVEASKRARYDPVFVIHADGEMFKSELSKIFTAMFVRKDDAGSPANMLDLDSDPAAINSLSSFKDCSVLLDGVRKTGSRELDRRILQNAITVINRKRGVANSEHDGKNAYIRASTFINTDSHFTNLPLTTRCVFFHLDYRCSSKNLTWYQEHIEYFVGLKILFIQYILRNYEKLVKKMKCLLGLKQNRTSKTSSPSLRDSNAILNATAEIFLDFHDELSHYSRYCVDTSAHNTWYDQYIKLVNSPGNHDTDNYASEIPEIYQTNNYDFFFDPIEESIEYTAKISSGFTDVWKQTLVDDFLKSLCSQKAKFVTDNYAIFISDTDNCGDLIPEHFVYYDSGKKLFYVKAKHLKAYFEKLSPKKLSKKKIISCFDIDIDDDHNLIKKEGGDRTIHINSDIFNNVRYICIKEKQLKRYLNNLSAYGSIS